MKKQSFDAGLVISIIALIISIFSIALTFSLLPKSGIGNAYNIALEQPPIEDPVFIYKVSCLDGKSLECRADCAGHDQKYDENGRIIGGYCWCSNTRELTRCGQAPRSTS